MADINAAVKETSQQIRGDSAEMFGQLSQGLAQQLGEAVRGMHGAGEQHMQHMLRMLTQEKVERKTNRRDCLSAVSRAKTAAATTGWICYISDTGASSGVERGR